MPRIVGRSFELMGQPFTVVGVTPREFFGLEPGRAIDITVPLSVQPLLLPGTPLLTSADARWLRLIGRPVAGMGREPLRSALGRTWSLLETVAARPADERPTLALLSGAQGLNDLRRAYSLPLRLLLAAVTVLLLVACVNLAGLLLARAKARQHEIGLRLALGASRVRIVRQMLTEAALISLGGSVAGLVLAYWGRAAVLDLLSRGGRQIVLEAPIDVRLLGFTIGVMAATTLLFGLWPALRASAEARSQHLRTTTPSKSTGRQTAALIAAQTALAVVLVAAGALFVRSLTALHAVDAGFRKERVLLANIRPAVGGARRGRGATHLSGAVHALHEACRRSRGHAHARHAAWRQVGDRRDRRGRRPWARASRSGGAFQHRRSEIPGDDGRADSWPDATSARPTTSAARRRRLSARRLPGACLAPTAPSADSSKRIR